MFWTIVVINFIFYVVLPVIFLFTPLPLWVSSFWPNVTDFYLSWILGFFVAWGLPFLLLANVATLFTKPSRVYLLWIFVILNALTLILFWNFLVDEAFSFLHLQTKFQLSVKAATRPNDPQWTSPNALLRWGQEFIKLPDAWDIVTGSVNVKIGMIDFDDMLVVEITDKNTISYIDDCLNPSRYYYKVFVFDTENQHAPSNEASVDIQPIGPMSAD